MKFADYERRIVAYIIDIVFDQEDNIWYKVNPANKL